MNCCSKKILQLFDKKEMFRMKVHFSHTRCLYYQKLIYFLTLANFIIKLNKTCNTLGLPRPSKSYNFADPIKSWKLDY